MNDLGVNVATILDENQMSYSNMDDYIQMNRTEHFSEEKVKPKFNLDAVQSRNPDERDFSMTWGPGISMTWDYVPLEDQKTHINWRQAINDDGSSLGRLSSFPGNEKNAGANLVYNSGGNLIQANKEAMDKYRPEQVKNDEEDKAVVPPIESAKQISGQKDDYINLFRGQNMASLKRKCSAESLDPLLIGAIGFCTNSMDYDSIIKRYKELASTIDTQNPALIISAYNTSPDVILGRKRKDGDKKSNEFPRIDEQLRKNKPGGKNGGNEQDEDDGLKLNWADRECWLWTDFAKRFIARARLIDSNFGNLDLFPRVCYIYCIVLPECMNSRFDEVDMGFPFFDEQFANGITYSSPYGPRASTNSFHAGIDLGADRGEPIHAVHDGVVAEDGNGSAYGPWHGICINHGDGNYSRYLHCHETHVSVGQRITRGQVIGTVGGWGPSGPNSYDDHLHLEISPGDAVTTSPSPADPLSFYPKFRTSVHHGDQLTVS